MQLKFPPLLRGLGLAGCLALFSLTSRAQDEPDLSKMGHFKLRSYLNDNGFKTQSGHIVHVGDTLWLTKGTMPDKRFAFIYQDPTSPVTKTSWDNSQKAYLNSNAAGRKAIVKKFMTSGMRKGEYSITAVVGVAEPVNYWLEIDNAFDAGEISITKPTKNQ